MTQYYQIYPFITPSEDMLVHTADVPVCDDLTCPRHEESILTEEVTTLVEINALLPKPTTRVVVAGTDSQQEG